MMAAWCDDPIPPGHGEPDSPQHTGSSNVYTDAEWDNVPQSIPPTQHPKEDIPF